MIWSEAGCLKQLQQWTFWSASLCDACNSSEGIAWVEPMLCDPICLRNSHYCWNEIIEAYCRQKIINVSLSFTDNSCSLIGKVNQPAISGHIISGKYNALLCGAETDIIAQQLPFVLGASSE